ncbi:MAG: hypothetical protein QF765_04455, partial [Candidatus Marinimicrobia bacterium]|nr:hypothetical protein [Candidatus Neomarinimicrobiota bacterium]
MKRFSKNTLKFIAICSIFLYCAPINSQDMEIYETNKYGLKNITPSIIIDENSITGDFEVYSVNKYG